MIRKKVDRKDRRAEIANRSIDLPEELQCIFSDPCVMVRVATRCQVDDALVDCEKAISAAVIEMSILNDRRASDRRISEALAFNYQCVGNRMQAYLKYMECIRSSIVDENGDYRGIEERYGVDVEQMIGEICSFLRESMPSDSELDEAADDNLELQKGAILSDDSDVDEVCRRIGAMTTDSEAERIVSLSSGIIGSSGFILSDDDDD
jgi:hypothetical protein